MNDPNEQAENDRVQHLILRLRNHIAMLAPHQKERLTGKLFIEATDEIVRLYAIMTTALEDVVKQQPCCDGGGCFYPTYDGEGNHVSEQNVDPLTVIQGMVQTAQDALTLLRSNVEN